MVGEHFQTFMAGGMLVLTGAILFLGWCAWRYLDRERDMEAFALEGVGHELRINLHRLLRELAAVARGEATGPSDLLPLTHPQLDAVISRPIARDRKSLSVIRSLYEELGARKLDIRSTLAQRMDVRPALREAVEATIDGIGTLYLWECHDGRPPHLARSTRSWHVRDWMKLHNFKASSLPGLHLRDEVVERLRGQGMTLTPKPLDHTASQYYAKKYDRKADPNAPFWKRKIPAKPSPEGSLPPQTAQESSSA